MDLPLNEIERRLTCHGVGVARGDLLRFLSGLSANQVNPQGSIGWRAAEQNSAFVVLPLHPLQMGIEGRLALLTGHYRSPQGDVVHGSLHSIHADRSGSHRA